MRFIRYSLEKDKPIRAVLLNEGKIMQLTLRVVSYDDLGFYYTTSKSKKQQYASYNNLLSSAYARGDEEGK
ncbi:MAG: hypothetical protein GYA87_10325 [Christensenellaceae bacterium]|nr:hypothetical protein [Christensenellaceae bacterium]